MVGPASSTQRPGATEITRRLADICGSPFARFAGPADEVAGAPAGWVALPGNVQATAEVLRLAAEHDLTVVPRGAGTKLDWGVAPANVDILLDTGRLAGVWHEPSAGPVAEVGAGTPLRAVQASLERIGHRLPLDVPSDGATLGGVVAAGEAGPLRHRHGTPCDQLVEVGYLDAAGELIRSGGGISGTELARLLCGSQGGLGVLVSATLRVQPIPACRVWVTLPVWTPLELHGMVQAVLDAEVDPAAIELDLPGAEAQGVRPRRPPGSETHPAGWGRVQTVAAGSLVVLLEGGPVEVTDQARRLVDLFGTGTAVGRTPPGWWQRYPFRLTDVALRVEVPTADMYAAVYALRDAAGVSVPVRGSAGLGVLHAALPGSLAPERVADIIAGVRAVLLARRGRCVVVAAPPPVRQEVDLWGESPDLLNQLRVAKQRADPKQRLAPGRLPGGL